MRILIIIFFCISANTLFAQNPTTAQVDSLKKIGFDVTAIPQSNGSTLYKAKDLFLNDPIKKAMIDQQRALLKDSPTFYGFYTNNSGKSGLEILHVINGSNADKGGIKKGDILKYINGKLVRSSSLLIKFFLNSKQGDLVDLGIIRNGQQLDKQVQLDISPFISNAKINAELQKQKIAELERISIENAKKEKDRLAKLEEEKLEKERSDKLEKARLDKLEKEKLADQEKAMLAKKEKERLNKLEKERLDIEKKKRLTQQESDRLAKLEKKEKEKLAQERFTSTEAQKKKLENEERKRLKDKEKEAKKLAKAQTEPNNRDKVVKETSKEVKESKTAPTDNFYNIDEQDLKRINNIKSSLKQKWENERQAAKNPEHIEMTQEVAFMVLHDHGIQANAAKNNEGAIVTEISQDSYASKIFTVGDIIFSVDDNLVRNHLDLALVLEHVIAGDKINLFVLRNNSIKKLKYKPL